MNGPLVKAGKIMFRMGKMVMTAVKDCCCTQACGYWELFACTIPTSIGCHVPTTPPLPIYLDGCASDSEGTRIVSGMTVKINNTCYLVTSKVMDLPPNSSVVTMFAIVQSCDSSDCVGDPNAGDHYLAIPCPRQEGDPPPVYFCPNCVDACFGFVLQTDSTQGGHGFCYTVAPGILVHMPPGQIEAFCLMGDPADRFRIGQTLNTKIPGFICCHCPGSLCDSYQVGSLDCCCPPGDATSTTSINFFQTITYIVSDPNGGDKDTIEITGTVRLVNGVPIGTLTQTLTQYRIPGHGPPITVTVEQLYGVFYQCGSFIQDPRQFPALGMEGIFPRYGFGFPASYADVGDGESCSITEGQNIGCHRVTGTLVTHCRTTVAGTDPQVDTSITVNYQEANGQPCTGGCGGEFNSFSEFNGQPSSTPLAFGFL